VFVLTAGLGGIAAAQPGPPPQPPPPPTDTTTTTTDPAPPDPTPPPPPQPEPQPQPRTMPVVQEEPVQDDRPSGFSIGLGLGYGLPTSLETPNRTSARFRLGGGLTFEPMFIIANTTATEEPPMMMETETKTTEFGVAVLARLPVITHGHVDLEALATAGFTSTKVNPDGDFNSTTTNTFGIGWGVGVGYWLSRHWQLSMSVTNPLVQYQSVKQQAGLSGVSNTETETSIGVIFVPQVTAMIHLYN
jgi:hypothetical protein